MPIVFAVFQILGILWADHCGGGSPGLLTQPAVGFGLALLALTSLISTVFLVRSVRSMRSSRARDRIPAPVARGCAGAIVVLLAFLTGFVGLDTRLARAGRDRARLQRLDFDAVHFVDASVHARRRGRWGDEVVLRDLREVDSGRLLLERARLRIANEVGRGRPGSTRAVARSDPDVAGAAGARADRRLARVSRAARLLWPGARVRLGLRIGPEYPTRNPGTPDRERRWARAGGGARARLVDADWVVERIPDRFGWGRVSARAEALRRAWQAEVAAVLDAPRSGHALVRAIVLGDRSALPPDSREAFRRTGLAHLLAVSGLHVGFVAALAAWLYRGLGAVRPVAIRTWRGAAPAALGGAAPTQPVPARRRGRRRLSDPYRGRWLAGCLAAGFYAWSTGAAISVARASLLFGVFAIARWHGRSASPLRALACVGVVLLAIDPAALFDVGARFSFLACLALLAGGVWTARARAERGDVLGRWGRLRSALCETLRASLAVSLGTLPLVAELAAPVTALSPLFNAVAIPWTGFVVLPSALLAVVGVGCWPAWGLDVWTWPAAALDAGVRELAAWQTEAPTGSFFDAPSTGAARMGEDGLGSWGLWAGVVVGLGLLRTRVWPVAGLVWSGLAAIGSLPTGGGAFSVAPPRVVFFDVGQGDAALVEGRSSSWLIDTGSGPVDGSGGITLMRALRALGVGRLDGLVVTHGDLDHRGGAQRVLTELPVEVLWLPAIGFEDAALERLAELARQRGVRVRRAAAGDTLVAAADLEMTALWPPRAGTGTSRNDASLVLRARLEGVSMLFMADAGRAVEQALIAEHRPLAADVLKVAHHGSRGSTGPAFLASVAPRWVVLSAPCEATRGLPSAAVVERLLASRSELGWTGRDGAVALLPGRDGRADLLRWAQARDCR